MLVLKGKWLNEQGVLSSYFAKRDLANCGDDILGETTPTFENIACATSLPILNSRVNIII